MINERSSGAEFIERWFAEKTDDDQFDQSILALIDDHRDSATLKEDALCDELVALSREEDNGSD